VPYLHAELQIAGRQVRCDHVSYSFLQTTDDKGRPSSVVRTGFLIVVISGEAVGWSLWEEIKLNDFRRESGHVVFFQSEPSTAKRYTFYDAALIHLGFRHDSKGTTNRQAATEVELHFSAATIEVHGIRLENYSLIPWATSPATSFKALTKPANPLPSSHLKAQPAELPKTLRVRPEEVVYTSIGSLDKPSFDTAKLARIKTVLQKQGITVQQDEDAEKILDFYNAEAAYLPNTPENPDDTPVLMLRPNPSRAAVIEELLHLGQHRKTGFSPTFATNKFTNEIAAQNKLLIIGKKQKWTESEMQEIQEALEYWTIEKAKRNG
jgi:hypothetical protein